MKSRSGTAHSSSNAIESSTAQFNEDSKFLRDKSASCNVALDISPRPTTVIGISRGSSKKERKSKRKVKFEQEKKAEATALKNIKELLSVPNKESLVPIRSEETTRTASITATSVDYLLEPTNLNEEKSVSITSLASLQHEEISFIDEGRELTDRSSMTPDLQKNKLEEVTDSNKVTAEHETSPISKKDVIITEVSVHDIIKKFDEQKNQTMPKVSPRNVLKKPPEPPNKPDGRPHKFKPAVPPRSATTKLRGRLDKSHSTPAYDLSEEPLEALPMETKPIQPLEDSLNEIGIPIVETVNSKLPDHVQVNVEVSESKSMVSEAKSVAQETKNIASVTEMKPEVSDSIDVPPKPPPRNFVDLPKPVYPTDSPKPQLITSKMTENASSKQFFEYPDAKTGSQISLAQENVEPFMISSGFLEEKPPSRNFEPKVASTPVSKSKVDPDAESLIYKSIPSYELQKSVVDKKVSPTNSIVKAMIKSKSGKKKNSLIASEYDFGVYFLLRVVSKRYSSYAFACNQWFQIILHFFSYTEY